MTYLQSVINPIGLYRQKLNLPNAVFSNIDHQDGMVAQVFKISQSENPNLILKICPQKEHFSSERYFLSHFADKILVPKIVKIVEPEEKLNGAILMECIPGNLPKIETIDKSLAHQIGSILARIHFEKVAGYGNLTDLSRLSTDPRISFTAKFNEGLKECVNHLPIDLIEMCESLFNRDIDLLLSADGPRIIHRDFRLGNIIVEGTQVRGIIDWSSARGGFAEEDFCSLELDKWPTNCKCAFLNGYSAIRKVPHCSSSMPLLRLNRAIAAIGFAVKTATWRDKNALFYRANLEYIKKITAAEKC